jgi:ribosomal protein S4
MAPKSEHKRKSAKYKIDRRLGVNLWGRPKSPVNLRSYAPGQHGQRRKKPTDFGIQLMAKQKLKAITATLVKSNSESILQKLKEERATLVKIL